MSRFRVTVRVKLWILMTALIGCLSLAVYEYVPEMLRREALRSVASKAESAASMTAYAVAPALVFDDPTAALESFEGARRNRDLAWVAAYDVQGRLFAAWPQERPSRTVPGERAGVSSDGTLYRVSQPIVHDGVPIGSLHMALSLEEVNAQIARMHATVALITAVVFVLAAVLVGVISTLLMRPLQSIVQAAQDIAAGATGRRAEVSSEDEIGDLARSFNAMVGQLESFQRNLEARVDERTRELRQEIAERRVVEEALRESERRYRLLFERNLAGVYRTALDGRILDCNDACARVVGFESRRDLIGANVTGYFHDPAQRAELLERLRREKTIPNIEVHMRRHDGRSVWILESMTLVEGDGTAFIEGTLIDITARKEAEQQVEHQAYHDALTGLPNRSLFMDRLAIVLARARRKQTVAAVMFVDLDRFKYVNDTFGHTAGDLLLKQAAGRLRGSVREEDTVARLGGDEFTLLLADLSEADDAVRIAQKLIEAMAQPFAIGAEEVFVTPSIGIALYPADGRDADTLLRNADNAMYRAKESGRNTYQLYSEAVNKRAAMRLSLETSLRRAIEREEFLIHYQPQVRIDTWQIVGVEAMVRWDHPSQGVLDPQQFIPLAEETKLIIAIDEWVLREACRRVKSWEQAGVYIPRVAVNLSASQLHHRDLRHTIRGAIGEAGFDPSRVELEITESTAMHSPEATIRLLNDLRETGMRIAIDDFGMGHSALHYLHRFPVDTIKIDKSFVGALGGNPRSGAIVTAIVAMGRALSLNVVGEGVETSEQLAFLKQVGCNEIQGYLFSRPVAGNELVELCKRHVGGEPREPRIPI